MKTFSIPTLCSLGLSALTAFAQQVPSLAVAGVQASPVLLGKFRPPPVAAATVTPNDDADIGTTITGMWTGPRGARFPLTFTRSDLTAGRLEGEWRGTLVAGRVRSHFVLHLDRQTGGGLSATLENLDHGRHQPRIGGPASLVAYQARRLRVEMPNRALYEGNCSPGRSAGASAAPVSALEEVIRAIEVQMMDRLGAAKMFSLMEEDDLNQVIAAPSGQSAEICNLKNPAIAEQYRKEQIDYLLVTTLEDFVDQPVDLMQGSSIWVNSSSQRSYSYSATNEATGLARVRRHRGKGGGTVHGNTRGTRQGNRNASSSGQIRAGQMDPNVKRDQTVRLNVRYQLFEVSGGALLKSETRTFVTNRIYVALAAGSTARATSDFYQLLARRVADWAANGVTEAISPIKVLDKNDCMLTINRGQGAGIQVGLTYTVYVPGKEVKDPDTGEVLGRDEVIVGKAVISELHPKFCRARVLQDTGIMNGAILRRLP